MNYTVQNMLPQVSKYFKEVSLCEILEIDPQKPDIENILDVLVWPEIENISVVETIKGTSYEGQKLSGIKLVVNVKLKEKVIYTADNKIQSVHAAHFEELKSVFIIVPEFINGRNIHELVKFNQINIMPYIESVYKRKLNSRSIHKCVLLILDAKIFC
ncbi:hypothetical protein [Romboutsia sp.]|uniref:hypothetical protein n=1 Tax=Romboutsia sp. TaxID=1965302 RepID=UPI003F33C3CA